MASSGTRSPTVILETGIGAESAEWSAVQKGVESFAHVVRYDRAGRGLSDPAPKPRTAADMVEDLRALIQHAELRGPFVLVGHSLGGLIARLYAHEYRDSVVGMVLVDSVQEDQFDVIGAALPPPTPHDPLSLRSFRHFWTSAWRDPAATAEGIDIPASLDQGRGVRSLGNLPMHVLTAGRIVDDPAAPEPMRRRMQELHEGLQRRLLSLSPRAVHMVVAGSSHFIQRDNPSAIVEAIGSVLERARGDLSAHRGSAR